MASQDTGLVRDRGCPICQHHEPSSGAVRAEVPAEQESLGTLGDFWRGFFRKSCFFSFHRCKHCGQLYSPTYFSEDALNQLYASMDDNAHSGDAALTETTQIGYIDAIARFTASAPRYLEIGPDIGLLTKTAKTRFNIDTAHLVEPNRQSWPQLQAVFPDGRGTVTASLDEQDDKVPDQSLDLVVGIHVFDHLLQPSDAIGWVARKMRKGGVVAVVVHNERSLLARILGRRWPAYCLQHPQLYNPKTLKAALARHGLVSKAVIQTANDFPLGYLISHGLFAVTKIRFSLDFLTMPVRLRLGNMMVIATKGE